MSRYQEWGWRVKLVFTAMRRQLVVAKLLPRHLGSKLHD